MKTRKSLIEEHAQLVKRCIVMFSLALDQQNKSPCHRTREKTRAVMLLIAVNTALKKKPGTNAGPKIFLFASFVTQLK